jgi:hypothetical protein
MILAQPGWPAFRSTYLCWEVWQTRFAQSAAPTAATQFRRAGHYLCIFFVLCFSLGFFFTGVLVGVGEGVPEGSGVGDGRTRG